MKEQKFEVMRKNGCVDMYYLNYHLVLILLNGRGVVICKSIFISFTLNGDYILLYLIRQIQYGIQSYMNKII